MCLLNNYANKAICRHEMLFFFSVYFSSPFEHSSYPVNAFLTHVSSSFNPSRRRWQTQQPTTILLFNYTSLDIRLCGWNEKFFTSFNISHVHKATKRNPEKKITKVLFPSTQFSTYENLMYARILRVDSILHRHRSSPWRV